MKCNEIRNLVLPYLDSELDARTSQEIQLHLQSCAECAEIFACEEKFNERLFGVLSAGQMTPELWERIEAKLRPEKTIAALFRRWKMAMLGGLAVLILAGLATGVFSYLSKASSLDLAKAVEKDHQEFIEGKMKPQFTGALPEKIAGELRGRLDAAAFSTVPASAAFHNEGGRLCNLQGVAAAWTMGHCGDVPVSLIVFKKSELNRFPKAQARLETGEPIVCTRTGRFQFAVRFAGDHVVCAIANTSKQMLEDLLKSVPGAG
jgi:anti-sigma factor RsiW